MEYKLYRGGRYTVLGFPAETLIVDPVEYRLIYTSRCCHLDQLGTARPGIQVLSLPTGVALILLGGYPIKKGLACTTVRGLAIWKGVKDIFKNKTKKK